MLNLPNKEALSGWVYTTFSEIGKAGDMSIRIVSEEEGLTLNKKWRGIKKPTNVLAFSAGQLNLPDKSFLGDLAICAPIVQREAKQQGKSEQAHWAHMVIHGTLHLHGFDHIEPKAAVQMETLEKQILNKLNFPDPYINS